MAFIIPNATSTVASEKYIALDQAEPDSLDFEILGNTGVSGVYSGCGVTLASTSSVAVAAGTIVLNGVPYAVSSQSLSVTVSASSKFSLIVASVSGGVASLSVVDGASDAVNPRYPTSSSTATLTGDVNLANSVVLAAVYRTSADLVAGAIVDKRTFVKSSVVNQGLAAPTTGGTVGEFYFSSNQTSGTNSGLYVRGSSGWIPIQQNVGPQLPVGAVIAWPSNADIPSGFLPANGQTVLVSSYPELASAYGHSGSTFTLPNLNDHVLKGTVSSGIAGTTVSGSSDTVTLTEANLPSHSHGLNSHSHTMAHTHSIDHNHASVTVTGGSHNHSYTGQFNPANSLTNVGDWGVLGAVPTTTLRRVSTVETGSYYWAPTWYSVNAPAQIGPGGSGVSTNTSHSHTVDLPNHTGTSGPASSSTTSGATGNTSTTGSGSSFTNVPKAAYVIWIIRATSGDNQPAGTSIYSSARQEVVAISYEGTLPSGASAGDVSGFRLPWGATLLDVKASLDGVGITAGGTISVDVKLDGTTVLGANKLTIDSGESSSKTAATPADIAVTDLPDDSLVSIDIISANGETGPLNVVLYVIRND